MSVLRLFLCMLTAAVAVEAFLLPGGASCVSVHNRLHGPSLHKSIHKKNMKMQQAVEEKTKLKAEIKNLLDSVFNRVDVAGRVFKQVDINRDGFVDRDEAYEMVLIMYVFINRRAPVKPPTRATVNRLFDAADADASGRLSKDEFVTLASTLASRATLRVAAYKLISLVGAPVLASAIVKKLAGQEEYTAFWGSVIPAPLQGTLMSSQFYTLALTLIFVSSLGNFVLKAVDFALNASPLGGKDNVEQKQ